MNKTIIISLIVPLLAVPANLRADDWKVPDLSESQDVMLSSSRRF